MNKKGKNLKIVSVFLVLFILLFCAALALIYYGKKQLDEKDKAMADLQAQIESQKQFVYVATTDLTAGTVLEDGKNVAIQDCITALPDTFYISADDMGKVLVVNVDAWTPIMASMVTDETFEQDTRVAEIGVAQLMLDQQVNDYVDVRIMFPDGSDYIVLPKLKIKEMSLENNLFYANLGEDQIITLASATIDAFTVTGTKIYITKYVQANMQDESKPNYPVKAETLALMQTDPNILRRAQETLNAEARAELEYRLSQLTEDELAAINAGHGLTDTAHNQAFVDKQNQDVQVYQNGSGQSGTGTTTETTTGGEIPPYDN